jgi:chitin disaccharide deacetylase
LVAAAAKTIGFCADDVGLAGGVADTVVALAAAGRLSAASCVTTAPAWPAEGRALATSVDRAKGCELGLHFNLSEGAPLSADLARRWPAFPGLERLIALAHLGGLPRAALAIELRAQRDAFADALERAPDFIDGHQHVHHLPIVRDVLLALLDAEPVKLLTPAVRNTGHVVGPGHARKRMLIERTGGRALQGLLEARRIRHNEALLGVYDFRDVDYRSLVRGWLGAAPTQGGLVFCHPNSAAAGVADPIGEARRREAAYFASSAFADDLAAAGFSVAPAWQSSSAG